MSMKAFATGGSGFVGKNLIYALKEAGWEVYALARSERSASVVRNAGAVAVPGELNDRGTLERGMAGCDTVFHAAAVVELWNYEDELYRVNVEGTRNVLAASRKTGVDSFVHISAAAVISDGNPVFGATETSPVPEDLFGLYVQTKAESERMVLEANGSGFRTVALRPPAIWGRGDTTMLPELIQAIKKRQFLWIDSGEYPYATCHVRNVCEGALLAAAHGKAGEAYFLTDTERTTFRRFITDLLRTQGVRTGSLSLPRNVAWWIGALLEAIWKFLRLNGSPPITRTLFALIGGAVEISDIKARRDLGYTGKVSRAQGLAELEQTKIS
jgi:nucleoside-diphosphate-sugar epimerase